MEKDNTRRFSNRVHNYIKYRPSYPAEVLDFLIEKGNLNYSAQIADIGSGTGIFSKLLIDKGYHVLAVEPNEDMRLAAEAMLNDNDHFISVNGTAENTNLPDHSIDLIVCAQAFHWFDPDKARTEFRRILKDTLKPVALIWNNRLTDTDDFAIAYDNLLAELSTDYNEVNHQHLKGVNFEYFFKDGKYSLTKFANQQVFDYDGLAGRAYSSSYVPDQNTTKGIQFGEMLRAIFEEYQINNQVKFNYETEVYIGLV